VNAQSQLPGSVSVPRRHFLQAALQSVWATVVMGCDNSRKQSHPAGSSTQTVPSTTAPQPLAQGRSAQEVLDSANTKADYYMRLCHHCAQSSFLALHQVFGLGEAAFVKALTPLPGIAERGETCGAVTGCLLALGLVYGRDRLDDWAGWRACLVPARKFCDAFVSELGSTQCGDIVERLFGRRYNLADPVELGQFQEANPTPKCSQVVRTAVRIAAGLILDKHQNVAR